MKKYVIICSPSCYSKNKFFSNWSEIFDEQLKSKLKLKTKSVKNCFREL